MRFLLETDHYVDDQLLEKGLEVGDGPHAVHDWRFKEGGNLRPVSHAMSPLDDEAKAALKRAFGTDKPTIDPTASIPIQGTTKAPGLANAKAPALAKGIN